VQVSSSGVAGGGRQPTWSARLRGEHALCKITLGRKGANANERIFFREPPDCDRKPLYSRG